MDEKMKPILFSTEMVRAILDGRKSVTRRVIKLKYGNTHIEWHNDKYGRTLVELQNDVEGETYGVREDGTSFQKILAMRELRPPYRPGDILYVRETWCKYGKLDIHDQVIEGTEKYYYRADGENPTPFNSFIKHNSGYDEYRETPLWRPSIHMPKEAARIFLRVKNVSAECLQEITEDGAKAEGALPFIEGSEEGYLDDFIDLWNNTVKKSDHDKYGWNANPFVWVIKFERVDFDGNA